MLRIYQFLQRFKNFFFFLMLELIALWLLFSFNKFQNAALLNSSNTVVATFMNVSHNVSNYFYLQKENDILKSENADLRKRIKYFSELVQQDSLNESLPKDTIYDYIPAEVINTTSKYFRNFITIKGGKNKGINTGMGVVTKEGVVGLVKSSSGEYSLIYSLLHNLMSVSAKIKRNQAIGSIYWNGEEVNILNMRYVPRHIDIKKGDTVVTSGFNKAFAENEIIGIVEDSKISDDQSFLDIKVRSNVDFSALSYVYVIKHQKREVIDSLQTENAEAYVE